MPRMFLWPAALAIAILGNVAGMGKQGAGLPAGTQIQVRLLDQLDSGRARAGQTFSATVANPVVVNGRTVLARDAKISGRVVEVVSSGRLRQPASLTLELTEAAGGDITTEPLRIGGKSHFLRNVAIIGGETGAGAIVGAAAGGEKGAAIGAAVGAGAGTGTAYMTGKKEVVLPVETRLAFVVAGESASPPRGSYRSEGEARMREDRSYFSDSDRRIILRYYEVRTENLPPGLAKRGGNLPPGLEKHLERDGTLPPGLQKRVRPLPVELERQLPPLASDYARVVLEGRVLIVDVHNRILDMMYISGGRRHYRDQDEDQDHHDD